MLWLELQSQAMRSWLQLAEAVTVNAARASFDAGQTVMAAWLAASRTDPFGTSAAWQNLTPLAFGLLPFGLTAALPFATPSAFGSAPWPFGAFTASSHPGVAWAQAPATLPWPMSFFSAALAPPRQPDLFDAMAASYRTASGYATAAIIAPMQQASPQPVWWLPQRGRGWLN